MCNVSLFACVTTCLSSIDFDNDGWLGRHDLECTIRCLTGENQLTPQEIDDITKKVIIIGVGMYV